MDEASFGWVPVSWLQRLFHAAAPASHIKIAAFICARIARDSLSAQLTLRHVRNEAGLSLKAMRAGFRLLVEHGLIEQVHEDVSDSGRPELRLLHPAVEVGARHARVYRAETETRWFREARPGVVACWLAHQAYLRDHREGRSHFAGLKKLAQLTNQTRRAVRNQTAWLESRGVVVRVQTGHRRPNLVSCPSPNEFVRLEDSLAVEPMVLRKDHPPDALHVFHGDEVQPILLTELMGQPWLSLCAPTLIHWSEDIGWVDARMITSLRAWLFLGVPPVRRTTR